MTISRLLVVDDDKDMRLMMAEFLKKSGFMVMTASNRNEIEKNIKDGRIDLILLDVMLGTENGVEICKAIRKDQDVPIILVSALSTDSQRMAGYEVGADDYIAKPFNPSLLLARIKAVLKRSNRSASLIYRRDTALYKFAGWSLDGKKHIVTAPAGFEVALSKREVALLRVFLANAHIPLTRQEIATSINMVDESESAIGMDASRALDMLVGRLRSKIEVDPKKPQILQTERGVGYVFAVDVNISDD